MRSTLKGLTSYMFSVYTVITTEITAQHLYDANCHHHETTVNAFVASKTID